jgi:hypothetical protein
MLANFVDIPSLVLQVRIHLRLIRARNLDQIFSSSASGPKEYENRHRNSAGHRPAIPPKDEWLTGAEPLFRHKVLHSPVLFPMGWIQPAHFSFPHGLDETSPFFFSPWAGSQLVFLFPLVWMQPFPLGLDVTSPFFFSPWSR